MAGNLPPLLIELQMASGEFMAKMGEARHEIKKLATDGSADMARFQAVGKAALIGFGTAAVAVGTMAVKEAMAGQEAHAKLAQAVKNTGGSMEQVEKTILAHRDAMAHLGFSQQQYEDALAVGTTALGSATKAQADMNLAMDLARYKHVDLSEAMVGVAKASEGNLRALKQMGIDLPVVAASAVKVEAAHKAVEKAQLGVTQVLQKYHAAQQSGMLGHNAYVLAVERLQAAQQKSNDVTDAGHQILTKLSGLVGGQASEHAKTFAGQIEAMTAQTKNLLEELGNKLIPVIQEVIADVKAATDFFGRHKTTTEVLAYTIGTVLVAAIGAYMMKMAAAVADTIAGAGKMILRVGEWVTAHTLATQTVVAQQGEQAAATEAAAATASTAMATEAAAADVLKASLIGLGTAAVAAAALVGAAMVAKSFYDAQAADDKRLASGTAGLQQQGKNIMDLLKDNPAALADYKDQVGWKIDGAVRDQAAGSSATDKDTQFAQDAIKSFNDRWGSTLKEANAKRAAEAQAAQAKALAESVRQASEAAKAAMAGMSGPQTGGLPGLTLDPAAHITKVKAAHHKTLAQLVAEMKLREHQSYLKALDAVNMRHQLQLAALQKQLFASQEAVRQAELANRLAQQRDINLLNGAVSNQGLTFQGFAQPVTQVFNIGGSLVSERQLTDLAHNGLLKFQRQNGSTGIGG